MENPYQSESFLWLRQSSRLGKFYGWPLFFPLFLAWLFSRLFSMIFPAALVHWVGRVLRNLGSLLMTPFSMSAYFLKQWVSSRVLRDLIVAIPLLLALIWTLSILLITQSPRDEDLFADYRSAMLNAAHAGDFDKAHFLAGKLLNKAVFSWDKEVQYAAMIAAHETKDYPRRDMLLARLTGELEHVKSHLWYAQYLLSGSNPVNDNFQKAVQQYLTAIKLSDNPEPIRIQLAMACHRWNRTEMAVNLLKEDLAPDPATAILLAKLYIANKSPQSANALAAGVLRRLNKENPEMDRYTLERIDIFTILAETQRDHTEPVAELLKITDLLESQVSVNPDDELIKAQLAKAYMVVGQALSSSVDVASRHKALVYFQKSISLDRVYPIMGPVIYQASGLDGKKGLTLYQTREALVRGNGPAVAHLFLAMDAWRKDLRDELLVHMRLAYTSDPNTMTVVEYLVMHIANLSAKDTPPPFRISLDERPLWRRSLDLLDLVSRIDASRYEKNLYNKCVILAKKECWDEAAALAESHVSKSSDEFRVPFLQLIKEAHPKTEKTSTKLRIKR